MKIANRTISLLAFLALSQFAAAGDLFIEDGFAAAKAMAKESDKLVMIDFKAEWCGPCKMLDRTTWSDEKVISTVKSEVIAVKIDVDENREIAMKYRIRSIPTIVFVDSEGNEVSRFTGYRNPEGFLKEFKKLGES